MAKTQQERRADTRQRLLTAARDVIAERGVAGASIDALAEAAERTSGALYAQFGNKDGLLLALPVAAASPCRTPVEAATLVIALMIGLEMQRRLDPDAVGDDLALAGMRALLGR